MKILLYCKLNFNNHKGLNNAIFII